jgi:hypothetical protein
VNTRTVISDVTTNMNADALSSSPSDALRTAVVDAPLR